MNKDSEKWTTSKISKELGIYFQTVDKRFRSKYASVRWGVVEERLPDGSVRRYVPADKIYLWRMNTNYVGRPVFK